MIARPPMHATASPSGGSECPIVEFRAITKTFGPLVACDAVDLAVVAGEIHGLLGENGAGKSTLVKVLIGLLQPDEGEILIDGVVHRSTDPRAALAAGIGMVHQHFSLVPTVSVWENVVLTQRHAIKADEAIERITHISGQYGLDIDPEAVVGDLTAGQRQRVEIVKCLWAEPRIVVLDEPTSVLTRSEALELFETLRMVASESDRAVILISHKLDEILAATDNVTVLRQGRVVARRSTAGATPSELAEAMVGRQLSHIGVAASIGAAVEEGILSPVSARVSAEATPSLVVRELVVGRRNAPALGIDELSVAPGEVVGLAGVEGNGQVLLASVLAGVETPRSGTIEVRGLPVDVTSPGATQRSGISVITDDRHVDGCALDLSVGENLLCNEFTDYRRGPLLSRAFMEEAAARMVERYGITTPSVWTPMRRLSGGNQQKVVVARELSSDPAVVVACQATRGLDVGAAEFVITELVAAAERGVGILFVSSDLDELFSLADRIVVMYRGAIVGQLPRSAFDRTAIGLLMGGSIDD